MTKATDKLGANGEDLACSYLEEQGYTILERNLTCGRLGELDIVAGRAGFLCFIEVKTRSSELYGLPCEAVTKSKQKKLRRCAQYYLLKKGYGRKVPSSLRSTNRQTGPLICATCPIVSEKP